MKFTVFGSSGYIGSSLVKKLKTQKIDYATPNIRNDKITQENLGHVVYAIGVPNFKQNPLETIESDVILLKKLLDESNFDSFLYLSSTRVYFNSSTTNENSSLVVEPSNYDNLYNISKIMGEAICNVSKKQNIRIARLSNVTGNNFNSNVFLSTIIKDVIKKGKIILQTKLDSERDYVYIDDVLNMIIKISLYGKNSIYNIANGKNLTNDDIVKKLQEITKCEVEVMENAKKYSFLPISINRIQNEFNFVPTPILSKFEEIVSEYKNKF